MEPASDIKYKRLTRSAWRGFDVGGTTVFVPIALLFQSRLRLWLGPDHLLSVESTGYTEKYKRFYFRDIQAILVQKTNRFRLWTIILGIMIALMLVFAFLCMPNGAGWTSDAIAGVSLFGFILAILALILVLHLFSGPTCRTYLRTAVQIEELPSLNRVKRTRRVLAKIRPLIATAQGGELSPEAVATQMREFTAPAPAPTATAAPDAVADDPNVPPRLNS